MNEQVLKMISTLHARLDDVEAVVRALPSEQPQFATKLDKVDDKVYLIQCEMQKLVPASTEESPSQPAGDSTVAEQDSSSATASDSTDRSPAPVAAGADDQSQAVDDVEAVGSSKDDGAEEEGKPLISDEMKDNLKDAGRTLGGILKDSKDVVSELSGTVNDLKSVFKFK